MTAVAGDIVRILGTIGLLEDLAGELAVVAQAGTAHGHDWVELRPWIPDVTGVWPNELWLRADSVEVVLTVDRHLAASPSGELLDYTTWADHHAGNLNVRCCGCGGDISLTEWTDHECGGTP